MVFNELNINIFISEPRNIINGYTVRYYLTINISSTYKLIMNNNTNKKLTFCFFKGTGNFNHVKS